MKSDVPIMFFFLAVVDDPPARNQIMRVCILLQRINPARSLHEDQPTWKLRKEGILYCSKRERLQRFFLAHKSLALLAFPFLLPHYWSAVVKSEPILSRPYCDKPEVVLSVACAHATLEGWAADMHRLHSVPFWYCWKICLYVPASDQNE